MRCETRKREIDVFVCFFCARASKCKHSHDNTAVALKPRMSDNQYSLLGETVSIYYSSDYRCDHVYMCTYTQLQKAFSRFSRVFSHVST